MIVYYYGVWAPESGRGHALYDRVGMSVREGKLPATYPLPKLYMIDGLLAGPHAEQSACALAFFYSAAHVIEIRAGGGPSTVSVWTLIQCGDYTGDERPGSNSGLIAEGRHTFRAMRELWAEHFPAQLARIEAAAPLRPPPREPEP